MTNPASAQQPVVLFVDDDRDFLNEIASLASSSGLCEVETLGDSTQLLAELQKRNYSAVFMDWVMPVVTGADLLPVITAHHPALPLIVMTGNNDVETAVDCMKQGAADFITKPLDSSRLLAALVNALRLNELASQNRHLESYLLGSALRSPDTFSTIITVSEKMITLFKLIESLQHSRHPVFITGETGVGKELIARAMHTASGLGGEFVPLNVAGLDPLMFDDTLFGHRKGAFTGAAEARPGLIAKAQGGTLFLDEIGDLSRASQVKLLRLLQENEYYRIGSDMLHKSNARIITASNSDFSRLLKEGSFREDLFQRLSYHRLHVPPLRERKEDILPLARHFAALSAAEAGIPRPRFSAELKLLLSEYDFPGNVRELQHRIGSAVITNRPALLTQLDFPDMTIPEKPVRNVADSKSGPFSLHAVFPEFPDMEQIERLMLSEALKRSGGRKGEAAELLGITRQTLKKWLIKMDQ